MPSSPLLAPPLIGKSRVTSVTIPDQVALSLKTAAARGWPRTFVRRTNNKKDVRRDEVVGLLLGGLDRFHLLLGEFLPPLQDPLADPFLEDFQVGCTFSVGAPEVQVHVARLPILGVLSVVQPSHQGAGVRSLDHYP